MSNQDLHEDRITLELRKALRVISPAPVLLWGLERLYEAFARAAVLLLEQKGSTSHFHNGPYQNEAITMFQVQEHS